MFQLVSRKTAVPSKQKSNRLSNKKQSILLLLLSLILLLTGCLRQPQNIIPLTLEYQNFTVEMHSFGVVQVNTNFKVTNPNPFSVQGEAHYKFYLGEQTVEVFSGNSSRLKLAAKQTKDFQLQNRINLLTVFDSLSALLLVLDSQDNESLPFSLEGKFNCGINLGWFNIPVSVPILVEGKIPLPKAPTFKINRVKFDGLSFYPEPVVKIGVDITVNNKNSALLNLNDFGYQIKYSGKNLSSGRFSQDKKIPAKESRQEHFVVKIPMENLSQSFVNELKSKKIKPTDFELKRLFNNYPKED